MKQILHWAEASWPAFSGTFPAPILDVYPRINGIAYEPIVRTPWSVAGTLANLTVSRDVAPGTGKAVSATIYKNGSATGLTITITHPATSASDTSNTVTLAAGDHLSVVYATTGGAPATSDYALSLDFDSGDDYQSGYGNTVRTLFTSAVAHYAGLCFTSLDGKGSSNLSTDLANYDENDLCPLAGTITRLDVKCGGTQAPFNGFPAGEGVEFAVVKNGVVQDGSGGTPDTRTTLTEPAVTASWTGTLTIAANDLLKMRITPTAGMVGGNAYAVSWSARFNATTAHRFWLGGWKSAVVGTPYFGAVAGGGAGITESQQDGIGAPSASWYLLSLHSVADDGAAGTPTAYRATVRRNGATPANAPQCVFVTGRVTALSTAVFYLFAVGSAVSPGTGSFTTIAPGDTWSIVLLESVIQGSLAFGMNTTVTAPQAIAFGVDGNTNEHATSGMVRIFGDLEISGAGVGGLSLSAFLDGLGT